MQDNLVATAGNEAAGGADIRLRKGSQPGLSVRIPGLVGTTATDADNKITAENPNATTVTVTGANFTGGAACTQPTLPAAPSAFLFGGAAPLTTAKSVPPVAPSYPIEKTMVESTQGTESNTVAFLSNAPTEKIAKRDAGSSLRNSVKDRWITSGPVNSTQDKTRPGISSKSRIAPLAGETVSHSIGTLPAGKTVHIQFQVTVNNPYLGGEFVSNQGTVSGSNFADVLTDDPAVGGSNDPTQTPILQISTISVADAQVAEPSSGSTNMVFTVTLNAPAPAGGASVDFTTQDQAPPAPNHATAGQDYTTTTGTVNFAQGEQIKVISVPVLSDNNNTEQNETFLVVLSNPVNATIANGTSTGTILIKNQPGTILISELRTSGPAGEAMTLLRFITTLNRRTPVNDPSGAMACSRWELIATQPRFSSESFRMALSSRHADIICSSARHTVLLTMEELEQRPAIRC